MKPADAERLLRRVTRETETSRRLQANLPTVIEAPLFDEVAAGLTPNREFDELLLHD